MQAIYLTDHAKQRAAQRGMPPYVLRKAAQTATYRGHGNCAVVTQYGQVIVHHDTVVTVLSPKYQLRDDLQRVYLR
jgi:hypothetical protein